MGLDATIRKKPMVETIDVKYWRKNWVLQHWMNSGNCNEKTITIDTMNELLEFIDEPANRGTDGSEGWTEIHWTDFREDIEIIIQDMEENLTYEYTYDAWW